MHKYFARRSVLLLALLSLFFTAEKADAFPYNVRHGYPNCTACHISPGGGGVLSAYGRELSRELQSTAGGEKETAFIYGAVKTPEWLDMGGDVRYIQVFSDSPTKSTAKSFWMQADIEAAVHVGKVTVVGAIGWKGNSDTLKNDSDLISRRHYAIYALTDRYSVRAGRFYPVFGTMAAEHRLPTRREIGFDQGKESYNLEFASQTEFGSTFFTPIFGKREGGTNSDEYGFAVSQNFILGGNSRVGGSFLYGKGVRQRAYETRYLLGPNAIVSLSKQFFWIGEYDVEVRDRGEGKTTDRGIYQYQKLTYEPIQGVQFSMLQDFRKTNVLDPNTQGWSLGPVFDWYPRPHLDFQLSASRIFLPEAVPNSWAYAGVFHYYL